MESCGGDDGVKFDQGARLQEVERRENGEGNDTHAVRQLLILHECRSQCDAHCVRSSFAARSHCTALASGIALVPSELVPREMSRRPRPVNVVEGFFGTSDSAGRSRSRRFSRTPAAARRAPRRLRYPRSELPYWAPTGVYHASEATSRGTIFERAQRDLPRVTGQLRLRAEKGIGAPLFQDAPIYSGPSFSAGPKFIRTYHQR